MSKKAIDFNYLFFNKSFLKNITNYSKSSEYLFQSKLVNAIKDSIKKSKVSKFKNLYDSLEAVTKFDQFFESLNNKIGEDSSKFDTIIQTERFDIISYYLEFGVWKGRTINYLSRFVKEIYGFDSFKGLREDWVGVENKPKGKFDLGEKIPSLNKNVLPVKGWIQDTLEIFLQEAQNILLH